MSVDSAVTKATLEETTTKLSALKANISKRGDKSYYYAHTGKYGKGGDTQCKGGKPQKLSTKRAQSLTQQSKKIIDKYMWYDGSKRVTIIVDWPAGFETLAESQTVLECTGADDAGGYRGVTLSVNGGQGMHVLHITDLHEPVASASVHVKADAKQILVKMKKTEKTSWYRLRLD